MDFKSIKTSKFLSLFDSEFPKYVKDNFEPMKSEMCLIVVVSKHLMTGHKGNSEFCFPETLN